jgi:hypothetical protein
MPLDEKAQANQEAEVRDILASASDGYAGDTAAYERDSRKGYHPYLYPSTLRSDNILDPTDPKVVKVLDYLQNITDNLLRASGVDPIEHPVKIVLYSKPDESRAFHWHVDPPLIGINRFFWDQFHDEDSLAHSIGHELAHSEVRKYTGLLSNNSKQEEMGVQARGLHTIAEAGYNPQRVIQQKITFATGNFDQQASAEHVFEDDHAAAAHDLREMENTLAAYERAKGRRYSKDQSTPIPADIQAIVRELPSTTHVRGVFNYMRFERLMQDADALGKIDILRTVFEKQYNPKPEKYFIDHLKHITYDPSNAEQRQSFNLLARQVTRPDVSDKYSNAARLAWMRNEGYSDSAIRRELSLSKSGSIFTAQREWREERTPAKPFGELHDLNTELGSFISASDRQNASIHAARALEILQHYNAKSLGSNYYSFHSFNIPTTAEVLKAQSRQEAIKLPYSKHLDWLAESGDPKIAQLLIRMGVAEDPHAAELLKGIPLQDDTSHIVTLNADKDLGEQGKGERLAKELFGRVSRNEQGYLVGVSQVYTVQRDAYFQEGNDWLRSKTPKFTAEAAIDAEWAWRRQRYKNEQKLVASANWVDFEKDPRKFLNQYAEALTPENGILPSKYPFAERLMQEAKRALSAGNPKVRKALTAFFGNRAHTTFGKLCAKSLDGVRESGVSGHYVGNIRQNINGLDAGHPFYAFIADEPYGLLSHEQKIELLNTTQVLKPSVTADTVLSGFMLGSHRFFADMHIQTAGDLSIPIQHIFKDYNPTQNFDAMLAQVQSNKNYSRGRFEKTAHNVAIKDYLFNNSDLTTFSPQKLNFLHNIVEYNSPSYWPTRLKVEEVATKYIDHVLATSHSPAEIMDTYTQLMGTKILMFKPEAQEKLRTRITQVFSEEPSPYSQEQRTAWAKQLLERSYPSSFTNGDQKIRIIGYYEGIFGDPELRNALIKNYLIDVTNRLGKDDGSRGYLKRLESYMAESRNSLNPAVRGALLPILADTVEAQPKAAYAIEHAWKEMGIQSIMGKQTAGQYAEFFTNKVSADPVAQQATIEFLMSKLSKKGAEAYLTKIAGLGAHDPEVSKLYYADTHSVTDNAFPAAAEFHKNYWNAPLEGRVWYLEKLLFPVNEGSEIIQKQTVHDIVDRVVPDPSSAAFKERQSNHGFEPTSARIARTIIHGYLDSVSLPEQRLLATAMLVADGAGVTGETPSIGRTLHIVLSNMGTAGAKLEQAIHSHPDTPPQLKRELGKSKSMHNVPLRWNTMRWWEAAEALDGKLQSDVAHIGKVEGAGSIAVALDVTMRDGTRAIDRVLRPDVVAQSNREFENMMLAIKKSEKDHPDIAMVKDMIQEAQRSVAIEANFDVARSQNLAAESLYHSDLASRQTIGNTTYEHTFSAAPIIDVNASRMRIKRIDGDSFNALKQGAQSNPQTAEAVRADARTIRSIEFIHRLSGLAVDRDRHGENLKISEIGRVTDADGHTIVRRHVGNFDFGAMELSPATTEQKAAFGKVLGQALKDAAHGQDFTQSLLTRIEQLDAPNETKMFLAGIKRGELAQGDYLSGNEVGQATFSAREMKQLLGVTLKEGYMDPIIQHSIEAELGPIKGPILFNLIGSSKHLPLNVSGVPQVNEETLPMFARTQRLAIQSAGNNGIGVAMGGYGLYHKLNETDGTFQQDMESTDAIRRAGAVTSITLDGANIVAGALSTADDMATVRTSSAAPRIPAVQPVTAPIAASAPIAPAPSPNPVTAATQPPAPSTSASTATDDAARLARAAGQAEQAAAQGAKGTAMHAAGRIANRAAIPLAVAAGGAETFVAVRAGDRERATSAVGGTFGGIVGGFAVGAGAGALMGATTGSVVPGAGTIVVGVVAGVAGGIGGAIVGEQAAQRYASRAIGWLTGIDSKIQEAMRNLDPRLRPFLDVNHDGSVSVDEVHALLKRGNVASISRMDTNGDGKLSGAELNQALTSAVVDQALSATLPDLRANGLGAEIGRQNGNLTLAELKAAFPEGFDFLNLITSKNGRVSATEIVEALHANAPPSTPPVPSPQPSASAGVL